MSDSAAPAGEPRPRTPPNLRVKTPTVLQMEAAECGAAALGIVLGYHGRIVPLEQLRVDCGVSRDGSKAINLVKAARRYGLDASGTPLAASDLFDVAFPAILFWNRNHFVVLEGFRHGRAYINDPAHGPRWVSFAEFEQAFSGIALVFKPGPTFERGGVAPSALRALWNRLSDSSAALLYVTLCGLMLVAPALLVPTFARVFVDDYLLGGRAFMVRPLLWTMLATAVAMMAMTWLQRHYLLRLETKLSLVNSSRFFAHIQRLPIAYFVQRHAGEIGSRLAINDRIARVIASNLTTTAINLCVLVFYLALLLWYDVWLTLVVMAVAALNVLTVQLVARARADAARRLLQDRGKLQGTAMGGLAMIETLKATGGEDEFFARWAGYQAKCLVGGQALSLISQTTSAVPVLVNGITTLAVYLFGGLRVMNGDMTVGMLVAYQILVGCFVRPLSGLVEFGGLLQELHGDISRLDDVLRHPEDARYAATAPASGSGDRASKLSGGLEMRDVSFGYSPLDPPLIEHFNLVIDPGQRVALVGASGSGKSTVARVAMGLYEPWQGQVLFDGVPRSELPRSTITNSVGVVDQEVFLFGGTIAENVSMWDATLPPTRIAEACRDACIDDVVESRPGGYQAVLEEGGKNLSGGQRQRLEIARALVGEPTLLVLDEATSALDPLTESHIVEALRRRSCTCLIIAHRLSTIRDADRIVVMERGAIVQQGTHEALKDVDGPYRSLISLA
jgi:NHLM bacteriocin system ABC transporter peptidase/ATP-binding protein